MGGFRSDCRIKKDFSFGFMTQKRGGKIQSIQDLLLDYKLDDKGKYISQEFQDYGYRLAMEMGEEKNKSLYIKLAKTENRGMLEKARAFVKDARNVRHKGKLFLWAVNKLRKREPLYENNPINVIAKER